MSIDLRCRHDRSLRELAAGMFDAGRGYESVAESLGIPARVTRKWQQTYRAVGRDGAPNMGKTHARYERGAKAAATSAVSGCGMSKREPGRLEAQVTYLKKSIALRAELRSRTRRRP